ncbi:MAG: hypothetical protein M1825_004506 [Sarcosagium campestre]|nr:MAG: hypothetical protein M1825_004506 [Sarcosagium campestre]
MGTLGLKTSWYPVETLRFSSQVSALLITNQPLTDFALFKRLWDHSAFHICADGGANRLFDAVKSWHPDEKLCLEDYLPEEICGDLDSIRPNVREFYESHGVKTTCMPSQEESDFTKCLRRIEIRKETSQIDVLVLGGLGGRTDQAFSQIHHLYMATRDPELLSGQMFLFSERNITFVLQKGVNQIHTPRSSGFLTENIGIIPVGCPAIITTKGLEWDVKDWSTSFGGKISTSNHIRADKIEVETDEMVLFTVERTKTFPV